MLGSVFFFGCALTKCPSNSTLYTGSDDYIEYMHTGGFTSPVDTDRKPNRVSLAGCVRCKQSMLCVCMQRGQTSYLCNSTQIWSPCVITSGPPHTITNTEQHMSTL